MSQNDFRRRGEHDGSSPLASGRCLAVLLGASEWDGEAGYAPAPEFAASASGIRSYIKEAGGLSVAESMILDLFNSRDTAEVQLRNLRRFLRERLVANKADGRPITDLLIYGISHGEGTRQNPRDLHLIVYATERGYIDGTGLSVRQLAAAIHLEAHGLRRYVVLDCCFSGAALAHFQSSGDGVATLVAADIRRAASGITDPAESLSPVVAGADGPDVQDGGRSLPPVGTVLLCSSHADDLSLTRAGDGRTLFTGNLLRALEAEGESPTGVDHDANRLISFSRLRDRTWGLITSKVGANAPYPQLYAPRQVGGDLSTQPLLPRLPILTAVDTSAGPEAGSTIKERATATRTNPPLAKAGSKCPIPEARDDGIKKDASGVAAVVDATSGPRAKETRNATPAGQTKRPELLQ